MKREHEILTDTPLPSGYTRLNYIESTGTQYIDTLMSVNPSSSFDFDIEYVSGNYGDTNYFGCEDYSNLFLRIYWRTNLSPQRLGCLFCDNNNIKGYFQTNDFTGRHLWHLESNNISFDGIAVMSDNLITKSTSLNVFLFASNVNGAVRHYSKAKLRYSKGIDDNIHKEFVPSLRISDNKPGLYDINGSICPLTGTPFYINAGTGEFLYA